MAIRSSRSARLPRSSPPLILADMVVHDEVKLDTPVAQLLPPTVKVPQRNGKQITLLDLAMHVSGLPRMPPDYKPADMENPFVGFDTSSALCLPLRLYADTRYRGTIRILQSGRRTAGPCARPKSRHELQRTPAHPHPGSAGHDQHQHRPEYEIRSAAWRPVTMARCSRPRTGISMPWPEPARFVPPPTICSSSWRPTSNSPARRSPRPCGSCTPCGTPPILRTWKSMMGWHVYKRYGVEHRLAQRSDRRLLVVHRL